MLLDPQGAARRGRATQALHERQPSDVPFAVADHIVWTNRAQTTWFGGWASAAPGEHDHWSATPTAVTAASARAWPRFDGWQRGRPWIEQLAALCVSDPGAAADALGGVFTLAHLSEDGGGVVASDPLGIGLLYVGAANGLTVVSNRAAMVAGLLTAAGGSAARDSVGPGWLAYAGYGVGPDTGFAGVSVLDAGKRVGVDGRGAARLEDVPAVPWRFEAGDLLDDLPGALALVRREMHTSIAEVLAAAPDACRVELTGGKDSRLVLAMLLEAGVAERLVYQTYGNDDLPDVVVARGLCQTFGLRHETNPGFGEVWEWTVGIEAAIRGQAARPLSSREIALRVATWSGSGMNNVNEPTLGRTSDGAPPLLGGLFGEVFRTNFPGTARYRTKADAAQLPDELGFGVAGLLRPEQFQAYRARMHALLFEDVVEPHSAQDVVDFFFVRHRLRGWFGPAYEFNTTNRFYPLYSLAAFRLAAAIGGANRSIEWLHHALMAGAPRHAVRPRNLARAGQRAAHRAAPAAA